MNNKNFIFLSLLIFISLAWASCGPNKESTTTTATVTKQSASDSTDSVFTMPKSSMMSVTVNIYFGNPDLVASGPKTSVANAKLKTPIKGGKHIGRFGEAITGDSISLGSCDGKGICSESAQGGIGSIPVTFTINNDNPYVLLINFNMNALKAAAPAKYKDFCSPAKTYIFDAIFDLSNIFSPNLLPPDAEISPASKSILHISKFGTMTDTVYFDHK